MQSHTAREIRQDVVRACLQCVLKSPAFAASQRLSCFLHYIVEETLQGRADRLKGYAIALSVFECGDKFDPQTNSVVRVEATRLRKRLDEYYAGAGASDPIEIRVNRGSYAPVFIDKASEAAANVEQQFPTPIDHPIQSRRNVPVWTGVPVVIVALILSAGGLYLLRESSGTETVALPPIRERVTSISQLNTQSVPSVTVLPILNESEDFATPGQAQALAFELASALSAFDDVKSINSSQRDAIDNSRAARTADSADYALIGSISKHGSEARILVRLQTNKTQEVVWTRSFLFTAPKMDASARTIVVSSTVSALARTGGVIMADRYRALPPLSEKTQSFACIVHASRYYNMPSASNHKTVLECLDKTLEADPKYSRAHAALALLLLDGRIRNYDHVDGKAALKRAAFAASEAIALAPQSAQAHLSQFLVRFYDRRFTDADDSAARALALNPYSVEIKARIASAWILRGDMDKASQLLTQVAAVSDHIPSWLESFYFLHAWMRNDLDLARRHAARTTAGRTPLGIVCKIIMASRDRDTTGLREWTTRLEEHFPRFARDIPGALDRMAMAEPMRTRLLQALAAAGDQLN